MKYVRMWPINVWVTQQIMIQLCGVHLVMEVLIQPIFFTRFTPLVLMISAMVL